MVPETWPIASLSSHAMQLCALCPALHVAPVCAMACECVVLAPTEMTDFTRPILLCAAHFPHEVTSSLEETSLCVTGSLAASSSASSSRERESRESGSEMERMSHQP